MSKLWPHATRENPCVVCGRPDWCQFGDYAMKCMRVASDKPSSDGGYYHFYDKTTFVPPHKRVERKQAPTIDAAQMMRQYQNADVSELRYQSFAQGLGVLKESLIGIGMAWAEDRRAWAFPMKDGEGNTIGIRLRSNTGFKWAVEGSRQGIFIPEPSVKPQSIVFLPEGPTDTAALLSIGLYAIGRPTCTTGGQMIKEALKRLGIYRAVIIADNDEMKRLGNGEGRPGIQGAQRLKKELGISSCIWIPPSPVKDIREFVNAGGTKQMIDSYIKDKIWTK